MLVHTTAVFVRVAKKGVAGYGTWKKVRKMGDKGTEAEKTDSAGLTELAGVETADSRKMVSWNVNFIKN